MKAKYISTGLHLGLRPDDVLTMTPGEFSDLIEIRNEENAKK